jgi:hypothetical protein
LAGASSIVALLEHCVLNPARVRPNVFVLHADGGTEFVRALVAFGR